MPSFDIKKFRLDIFIIIGFAVFSLLYCYPQLQGKQLKQNDAVMWQGMVHEAQSYHDSTGKDVLWSNSMFGGMPTFTYYTGANDNDYPAYVQQLLELLGRPAYFFFIAMLCFYILMRVLGVSEWLSVAGAIAYAFASYNAIIIGVGHNTKMLSIAYLPAVFAGVHLVFKEKWLWGAALFGISMALMAANGHYQVIFYLIIICLCYGVNMFFVSTKTNRIKEFFISTVIALVVGIVSLLPSITSVVTTNEYSKETMRGGGSELSGHDRKTSGGLDKEYAFRWSMGISETFCAIVPYLYGGATYEPADKAPKTAEMVGANADMIPIYWGDQPYQSGPVYFGAIICFLFILGLIVVPSTRWWMLAATIIGIVLSWGKNFPEVNNFLFDHIPYLNKFRTVEMALVIPQFLFPFLGILVVKEIMDKKESTDALWKKVKIAAGVSAGLCVLLGIGVFFNFSGPGDAKLQPELVKLLKDDRASLAMSSGIKSAIYILLAAALLWAFIKDKIKPMFLMAGLIVLIGIDMIPVAHDYLNEKNYVDPGEIAAEFEPRDVDKAIMNDQKSRGDVYSRVLDLSRDPYNDAIQCYFFKCIGGYSPAKMEMYQDLIDRQMGGKGFNKEVLNMMNTRYIIVSGQKSAPQVMPNPTACGNAWFVDEVKWANTADDEMNGLNAPAIGDTTNMPNAFNPRHTAVIRSSFKDVLGNQPFGKDSAAYVKLAQYGLDEISFSSSNSKDGLAVFSDIYYAGGWMAYVDGKETPIMKANYVLRAVKIPAGQHKIEFKFMPKSFYGSRNIAMVGSLLIIGLCVTAVYSSFRKRKEQVETKA